MDYTTVGNCDESPIFRLLQVLYTVAIAVMHIGGQKQAFAAILLEMHWPRNVFEYLTILEYLKF